MSCMHKISVLLLIAVFISCKEISYKEPQPRGIRALSEIPRDLTGEYYILDDDGNADTLVVTRSGYLIRSDSTEGSLGDSLVLKKYKGYYFFNDNENPEWLLRIIKKEPNGDLSYMYMDTGEKSFQELLIDLNKEIKIDSSEMNGEKLYQIDPSPRELLSIIRKGFFKKTLTLKKIK
jgi:hypothetical protein